MRGLAARLGCRAIREYQLARVGRPPKCRYIPSCSTYALEAVQDHGVVRGVWLAARRLVRCHPWGPMGSDPVPLPAARAARERSEQEREAPRRAGGRHHLAAPILRKTGDV